MTSKKIEISGVNMDDLEFSLLNKEFQVGIFRAAANEEGLLFYVNKILITKLNYKISSEFLYKKIVDLYFNPSDWLKHLECVKNEGSCFFRNVALKSSNSDPFYTDIYLTYNASYIYGIVHEHNNKTHESEDKQPSSMLRHTSTSSVTASNHASTKLSNHASTHFDKCYSELVELLSDRKQPCFDKAQQPCFDKAQQPLNNNDILVIDLDRPKTLNLITKTDSEEILDNFEITEEEKQALLNIQNTPQENANQQNIDSTLEEPKEEIEDSIFNDKTFNNAPFGMIVQKENSSEVFLNKKAREIFDIKENAIGYYSLFVYYVLPVVETCEKYSENKEKYFKNIISTLDAKEPSFLKLCLKNKKIFEYRLYPIIIKSDSQSALYGRVIYLFETTKEGEEVEYLKSLSFMDHLTGIYNRRSFDDMLAKNVEIAKRYKKALSLIMFDIDNFKQINDKYGHQKGDDILRELAFLVGKNIRKSDVIARYGGEEFMIISPETKLPQAMYLAEKIRSLIQNHKFSIDKTITCSFGVVQYQESESIKDFVARVDKLVYKAKHNGKNRVEIDTINFTDTALQRPKD